MKNKAAERISACILIITILCTLLPSSVFAEEDKWDGSTITEVTETNESGGSGSGYFLVSTGAQLAWIAQQVNSGSDLSGKNVLLTADIDLGSYAWTPIGVAAVSVSGTSSSFTTTGSVAFSGSFDGGSHTISNLSIAGENNGVALFGYSLGTIENLTVSGSVAGGHYAAGVAAVAGGTISGVTNQVSVSATGNCVGGIAAEGVNGITITDCHNRAYISNSSTAKSTGRVAGIVGRIDTGASGTISCCSNTADITGYQYVAGIIGGQFGNVDVSYCCNTGKITGISFGKVYLGGIAGKSEAGTISFCYNTGDLYDQHWSAGHIRAVGGIVGCEEDRTDGTTAVSCCYTTGSISFNTSNMTYGTNYIYMVGNISGGKSSTDANKMVYDRCFYLEGRIAIADSTNDSYKFWADVYKADPTIWDTSYITSKTETELKVSSFLTEICSNGAFVADTGSVNNGYPILYWQAGKAAPGATYYSITAAATGSGTATVSTDVSSASAGTMITVSISSLQEGKQIKSVSAVDTAGNSLAVTTVTANATYEFTMPNRGVKVTATIENTVSDGSLSYSLTLPTGLDVIWTVSAASTYMSGDSVKAGATVFVTAQKADDALMTILNGITVTGVDATGITSLGDGVYIFTMPSASATVSLDISYTALSVYSQTGDSGAAEKKGDYSRENMLTLAASAPIYYSGWSTETDAFVGKAEQAVTLSALLTNAGLTFELGDKLKVVAADGMSITYTYDYLSGTARYYYPNILSGSSDGKTSVLPMFVIKGNMALASEGVSVDSKTCDTLNAYRFVFGQSESDYTNNTKIVDSMLKCVSSIYLIKKSSSSGSTSSGSGNVSASVWDGLSLDVSWYSPSATSYYISTPAQLAGLAAIVNGIYNKGIDTISGSSSYIVANETTSTSGSNNKSTDTYYYGDEDFNGKTVYLTDNINMGAANYMPIGGQYLMTTDDSATKISASFNGTLDGQGHTVTINCDRHCSTGNYGDGESVGLVGRLGCHDNDSTSLYANQPTVRNVAVSGSVYANRSVGGIVGKFGKSVSGCVVENCANFASVSNTDSKGCGGIAGAAWNGGTITNCYNSGAVSSSYSCPTGGIAGSNESDISNCYNVGTISAASDSYAMAIGTNNGGGSVSNCYYLKSSAAAGGGYYNSSTGVTEKTSTEMKTSAFVKLLGSAFASDTNMINSGYPILSWQVGQTSSASSSGTSGGSSEDDDDKTINEVTFISLEKATVDDIAAMENKYSDIDRNGWYKEAAATMIKAGLFEGVSDSKFAPDTTMSRAMFVTVLYRLAGSPKVTASGSGFSDVSSDAWYASAVSWAASIGLTGGSGDNSFLPDESVSREQMALFIYRFAELSGIDVTDTDTAKLDNYYDKASVSSWSAEAMAWAVNMGIINGNGDGTLGTKANSTRAQVAQVILNFMEKTEA